MANFLLRLLRRQSPIALSSFTKHNAQYVTQSFTVGTHDSQSIVYRLKSILPLSKGESEKAEVKYDYLYPIFSCGLVVNPVVQKVATEERVMEENGSGKMWADSTKKKRKRKMNKHKYKKLMKRMKNH